jgi:hypothetical protein
MGLPDAWTMLNRLSRLMTSITLSSNNTLDGSPIHVLKILYPCWGLEGIEEMIKQKQKIEMDVNFYLNSGKL